MDNQPNSLEQLQANLSTVLTSWPLYRTYAYYGRAGHPQHPTSSGRYSQLPKQIRLFCGNEKCRQETLWQTDEGPYFFNRFLDNAKYVCRNCGRSTIHYYFIWQEQDSGNIFSKVGQYPELEERVFEDLTKALDPPDLKMYKNAIRLRNFNLGLAAVAYMRRVIENKMNDMLDILHEAAVAYNAPAEVLARHQEMKKEKRFVEKVNYAGDLVPKHLRPQGKPNPMATLHDLASDGLHARSDEECVDIFDKCRKTFEYVFGTMRIEAEHAKEYVESMVDLTKEKAKAAEAKPQSPKSCGL
jgi:hypothetical protein